MPVTTAVPPVTKCYHCGEPCAATAIVFAEQAFCCEGCKMVYSILQQGDLCAYYTLNSNPGLPQKTRVRNDKFGFLDDAAIQQKIIRFSNAEQVHVIFYLPQIHCSSCLYLLEKLHRLEEGIVAVKVNFTAKEISLVYHPAKTTLRKVAELLAHIGYEPYISLQDLHSRRPVTGNNAVYRVGVAGFCFGNIMLLSFPEYLGIDASETLLRTSFRWLSFLLSLPVVLYAAYPFFAATVKSIRQRFLTIDAPIALAILITFVRSVWEVFSGTGSGYFDSMAGIVFFMLAGRMLQDRTYRQLSFNRNYASYFPVAVAVLQEGGAVPTALPQILPGQTLLLHNEELIPADGILTRGRACIDYSFVTGEAAPVVKQVGELVYAGGRQMGENIEVLVVKEVSQSYLTQLWENSEEKTRPTTAFSFVHVLSRYFTWVVLLIAAITAVYWWQHDPSRLWVAVTAIFIIACPCALLLSNTFTNGSVLRILSRNGLYLRNAATIEGIARINRLVFDKTGTLTSPGQTKTSYRGKLLTALQQQQLAALAACSSHPLSKTLAKKLPPPAGLEVHHFTETPGQGIAAVINGVTIKLGSHRFVNAQDAMPTGTTVYACFNDEVTGRFSICNAYRPQVIPLIKKLQKKYRLSILSGDNASEEARLRQLLGAEDILFEQKPEQKLAYIQQLQRKGNRVMMIGDGLNDAGALQQSDIGVALSEDSNNFTPASDAILSARQIALLPAFITLCKANRVIVMASFILSIVYNIAGLYFAVQGNLSPMIAAILMPASSLCIFLVTFGASNWLARRLHL